MAMVVEAFTSDLCYLITQIKAKRLSMPPKYHDLVIELESKIVKIRDYVARTSGSKDTVVVALVREMKGALYDASDALSLLLLKIEDTEDPVTACWTCFPNLDHLRKLKFRQEFSRLNSEMSLLLQRYTPSSSSGLDFQRGEDRVDHTTILSSMDTSDMVPDHQMEKSAKTIIDIIYDKNDDKIKIIAIVGPAGIGKTFLATIINSRLQCRVDCTIWLNVTAKFTRPDLLRAAISSCRGIDGRFSDMSYLEYKLQEAVRDKDVLLVMDDVWSEKPWTDVLQGPLRVCNRQYSCVIVTTRNENVAAMMKPTHIYRPHKLKPDVSWSLMKNQIISNKEDEREEQEVDRLQVIGNKILEKCDGLPLAIKVLAGELQQKKTQDNWEHMLKNKKWLKEGLPEELNRSIYLSFNDLPLHLKQCFLYCSIFPEGQTITCDKLFQMWIAEGFIPSDGSSKLPEALGQEYYMELVARNLLEPIDGNFDECCCAMHTVFRSFAQYLAKDETLLRDEGENTSDSTPKFHRLYVSNKEVEYSDIQKHKSLRALVSTGGIIPKPSDSFSSLECLRILHVNNAKISNLPGSLHHLKLLKYLDLSNTDVPALPHYIGKMKCLQYICVHGCKMLKQLPGSIVNLQKLRFLDISDTEVKEVPKDFGKLNNLVTLKGFPANTDDTGKCNLEEIGLLSKLMHLAVQGLQKISSSCSFTGAKLSDKTHLTSLRLRCNTSEGDEIQSQEVFDNLCPSPSVEHLTITGYFGFRLPNWLMSPTLENLRMLKLENLPSCKELPYSLGQLPNLESLCVQHARCIRRIGEELFVPCTLDDDTDEDDRSTCTLIDKYNRSMAVSTPFPKLIKLVFHGLVGWKEWDWEGQLEAMRDLQNLRISRCRLSHLPPGLNCQAKGLRVMTIQNIKELRLVDKFCSIVELYLHSISNLEKIAYLPNMHMLRISKCPKLKVLEGVEALSSMELKDYEMSTLPEYLKSLKLRHLKIDCTLKLLKMISKRYAALEWEKISHIGYIEAYADGFDDNKRLHTRKTSMKQQARQSKKIITTHRLLVLNFQLPSNLRTKPNHLHYCAPGYQVR
uniref:AAA+ ATPase domain-containing protein n=1 Tax=Oryza barthii TaxID=65489 RepID=A0A0D3FSR9_9ORYZ